MKRIIGIAVIGACCLAVGCKKETTPTEPTDTNGTGNDTTKVTTDLPPGYDAFNSSVKVTRDGDWIVIETNDIPDHRSPYFPTTDSRYEAYNGSNPMFRANPNQIREQRMTFRIPRAPRLDPSHQATPLGAIGVALNGVAIFNQYAAGRAPLTNEINGFDQYNGHPQQMGAYHYHAEPFYLTAAKGKDALVGFLLDGFPVYGPKENGRTITNADLDEYHGHTGPTKEYPGGIYHYHVTTEDPYINGSGFYGLPGTVSQ